MSDASDKSVLDTLQRAHEDETLAGEETVADAPAGPDTDEPGSDVQPTVLDVTAAHPGRYRVEGPELGRGGLGVVHLAMDSHLGRQVAVKELLGADTARNTARFLLEARVTGQLEHPNIMPVYELGRREDGTLYYTMKVVRGITLEDALESASSLAERLSHLTHFVDLCSAIAYAHDRGVIHRDIKPQNVMVGEFGETVVLDWGIAKAVGTDDIVDADGTDLSDETEIADETDIAGKSNKTDKNPLASSLGERKLTGLDSAETRAGAVLGTPAYMSPEQAEGRLGDVDHRADIWSLGVVLYQMLTGQLPFKGESALRLALQVMQAEVPPVRSLAPDAPAELAVVCEKALQADPADRYQSANVLARDVRAYLTGGKVGVYNYGLRELLQRFVSQHRAAVIAVAVGVVALAVVLSISAASVVKERDIAVQATKEAREAETRAEASEVEERRQKADALLGAATAAFEAGRFTEARARLRLSVEANDTLAGRALWGRLEREPLRWSVQASCRARDMVFDGTETLRLACSDAGEVSLETAAGSELDGWGHESNGWGYRTAFAKEAGVTAVTAADSVVEIRRGPPLEVVQRLNTEAPRIYCVGISSDAKRLAICAGTEVQVWDPIAGKRLTTLDVPPTEATEDERETLRLSFSPDGSRVAVSTADSLVRIWDVETASVALKLVGHDDMVLAIGWSSDGKRLVTTGIDRTVRLWDATTGRQQAVLYGHREAGYAIAFSPDDKRVASGGRDRAVILWDAEQPGRIRTLLGHDAFIDQVTFSADGTLLASAGFDQEIRLWRPEQAAADSGWRAPDAATVAVDIAPGGEVLAVAAFDGTVQLWEVASGRFLDRILEDNEVRALRFSPDGRLVAWGSADGTIRLWNWRARTTYALLSGHTRYIKHLDFSADGKRIISGSIDGSVRMWDVERRAEIAVWDALTMQPQQVLMHPVEEVFALLTSDRNVLLLDMLRGSELARPFADGDVMGMAISPDGSTLAAKLRAGRVVLYDVATGQTRSVGHDLQPSNAPHFSPDGTRIAVQGTQGDAWVINLDTGEELRLEGHQGRLYEVRFGPLGLVVATTSDEGTVRVFDALTGRPLWFGAGLIERGDAPLLTHRLAPHTDSAWSRAALATGVANGLGQTLCLQTGPDVALWDLASDRLVREHRIPDATAVLAVEDGCVVAAPDKAFFFAEASNHQLDVPVRFLGRDGNGGALVVTANEVIELGAGESVRHAIATQGWDGITGTEDLVLVVTEAARVIRFDRNLENPFEVALNNAPAARATAIAAGPQTSVAVGFDDGTVGLWHTQTGERLDQVRIHGPVRAIDIHQGELVAISTLGDSLRIDLGPWTLESCAFVREVWARAPLIWKHGRAQEAPMPEGHACAP